jgi:hypothetical protein
MPKDFGVLTSRLVGKSEITSTLHTNKGDVVSNKEIYTVLPGKNISGDYVGGGFYAEGAEVAMPPEFAAPFIEFGVLAKKEQDKPVPSVKVSTPKESN